MKSLIVSIVIAIFGMVQGAVAQQENPDVVWVQIEAHPSLRTARERAGIYAQSMADVSGFALGGNWYGIMLGPYLRADADAVLDNFRSTGAIPQDAFIAYSRNLGAQFWPEGADDLGHNTPVTPQAETSPPQQVTQAQPAPADETPAEARRSERNLSADQRKALQVALQAAGFYTSAIDGAFGAGTRRSMADWQGVNGFEPTGTLTTMQRRLLMDQYNAPLVSVAMAQLREASAGIEMQIPAGVVAFSRFEPPFVHYDASTDLGARVLLISQSGDQATLFGLYDILQTLEIVPLDGPRVRGKDNFTLEGRGNGIVSYSEARLKDGQIKGFMLVWPAGDEARRTRVLAAMKASFRRIDGVLDPGAGEGAEQRIDLVSGLEVRKPRLSRSGFYVDTSGTVVTTAEAVQDCTRITLDQDYVAQVVSGNNDLGIAVLRPEQTLAPMAVARLAARAPRLQSEVIVSGYTYEGILGAPSLTYGTLADVKGLRGEPELARLALASEPGDAGGPVFDTGGAVLGMLLPAETSAKRLPGDVSFAANAEAIRTAMSDAGINAPAPTEIPSGDISPNDLDRLASGMTVLVSCWE